MNHFYRLVWNHVQNCWQVAHEATRSRGKGRLGGRQRLGVFSTARLTVTASMLTAISAVWADPADHALPTGANVVHGAATIELEVARLRVNQHTDRLITNWDSFDIGRRATVTFHQPSASSVALNRINNQSPTEIFGRLESNGHVILSNTSGVIFGKTAVVDVGALTATALQLKDEDFLAGRFKFQGASQNGGVINFGDIQARGGVVALIAPKVVNSGVMQANGGTVALAAGSEVTLDFTGSGLYTVTVKAQEMEALVQNSGAVIADDGLVILSAGAAGSLLKGLVNHSGTVQARSLVQQGGRIVLTGREIALEAGSTVDASGSAGGGVVHIGGEWQGHGNTRQANQVSLDAGATIRADATDSGHGGEVVLWSNINDPSSLTRVDGNISAQGKGPQSQGGRVETSGAELAVSGSVVTGAGGQWLIDPANIYVTSNGATSATAGTNTAGSSNTFISNASINAALDTGASVELYTGSTTANANQIHIQANITKSAGAASTLTLRTGGLIRVDSGVRITDTAAANPLSVTLETSGPIYLADNNSATPTVSIHGDLTMGAPAGGNAKGYVVNGSTDRTYQHGVYIGQHVGLSANNITVKGQGFDFTHSSFDGRVYDGGDGVHIAQSAVLDATSNLSISGVGGVGSRGSQGADNLSTGSNGSNNNTTGGSGGGTVSVNATPTKKEGWTLDGKAGGDAIGGQGGTGGSGTAGGVGGNGGRGVYIASAASLAAGNVSTEGTGGVGGIGGAGGKGGTGGNGGRGGTGGTGQNADLKNKAMAATCSGSRTTSAKCLTTYAGTVTGGRGGDAIGGKGGTGGRGGDGGAGGNGGVGVMVMTAASIQGARGTKVVGIGGRAGQGGTGGAGGQGGNGGQGGQGGRGGDGGYAYAGTKGSTTSTDKKSFSGSYFKIYSSSFAGFAKSGRAGYGSGGLGGDSGQSGTGGAGGDSGEGVRYESAVLAGAQVTTTAHITETGASGNGGAPGATGNSGSRGTGGSGTFGRVAPGRSGASYNLQRVGIGLRTTGATTIGSANDVTNISLITDTVRMDTGALVQTAAGGTLLVRPDTSGRFINLGSSATAISSISNSGTNTSTSQAKLNLSQDYFWNGSDGIFKDGFSAITIGSAASNNIVGSNLSFGDQLNLVTGQNITFTGSLTGAGQTLTTQVGSGKTGNFSSATVNVASLAIHSDANDTANWGFYTFGANTSTANEILNVAGRPQTLTLYNAKPLTIGTVDGITGIDASGDVIIRTDNATQANTGITVDAGAYVHTESNTATAIMLDAGLGAFDNNSGLDLDADDSTFTLATGAAGRWLVFSGEQDPTLFAAQRGGIAHQFKQYNLDWTHATTGATYAFTTGSVSTAEGNFRVGTNTSNRTQSAAIAEAATNGFIYRYAPSLTPEITQKVTKVYNRNASATVTTAHLVNGADADAIDGDTVRLTATSTGGTYFTTAGANDSLGRVEEEAITFASTANQIVFNAGVDLSGAGLEVWVRENLGATYTQLDADTDFTVSGSTVTLTAARQSGDIVQIVPSDLDGDGVTLSDVRSDKKATLANSSIVWQADNDGVNVYGYRITTAAQGYVGEITKKPLTVSGVTVSNFNDGTYSVTRGKVYDGSTVASISLGTANLQGTLSGDSVTLNKPSGGACSNIVTTNCYLADYLTANAGDNIGVTIRGIYLSSTNQASNYTLEGSASATGTIAPKVLNVTGTTVEAKPYDGTTLATITGSTIGVQTVAQRDAGTNVRSKDGLLVMREDGTTDSVSLTVSGNYINKNASTLDANVTYQITGADAANYTLDPGFRTNANKKQTAMWQLHDGADGAYKHRITSNVSVIQTSPTSGFSTTTTGHQIASNGETVESVTVNYSNGAIAGAASTPTSVAGIYKAPLTVIANDIEKVPGGADPTLTHSYSGFVAGETDAVLGSKTISRVAGEVPGTYTITAGATSNNYDITFVPGTFTIAPAEKLVIQINDASRDYGALTVAGTHYNVNASGAQYSTAQASITQANGTNATFSGPTAFDASKGGGVYLWNSGLSQWELVATADYSVSGNSITLDTAPASGVDVKVISQYSTKALTVTRDSSDPTKFILDDGLGTRMSVNITSDDTQSSDIGQYTVSVVNPDRVVTDQIFRNSSASSLTLTHSFVVGKGSVWKNGSLLSSANDYSVSGTTLTLQSPLSSSDELRVISDYDSRITLYQPNNGGQPAAPNFNTIASAGGVLTIDPVEAQIGIGGGHQTKSTTVRPA